MSINTSKVRIPKVAFPKDYKLVILKQKLIFDREKQLELVEVF